MLPVNRVATEHDSRRRDLSGSDQRPLRDDQWPSSLSVDRDILVLHNNNNNNNNEDDYDGGDTVERRSSSGSTSLSLSSEIRKEGEDSLTTTSYYIRGEDNDNIRGENYDKIQGEESNYIRGEESNYIRGEGESNDSRKWSHPGRKFRRVNSILIIFLIIFSALLLIINHRRSYNFQPEPLLTDLPSTSPPPPPLPDRLQKKFQLASNRSADERNSSLNVCASS